MKLFEVAKYSYVRVLDGQTTIPMEGVEVRPGEILMFLRVDGMYSICKNFKREIVHLSAMADVEIVSQEEFDRVILSHSEGEAHAV